MVCVSLNSSAPVELSAAEVLYTGTAEKISGGAVQFMPGLMGTQGMRRRSTIIKLSGSVGGSTSAPSTTRGCSALADSTALNSPNSSSASRRRRRPGELTAPAM